jgi:hypothetical protein
MFPGQLILAWSRRRQFPARKCGPSFRGRGKEQPRRARLRRGWPTLWRRPQNRSRKVSARSQGYTRSSVSAAPCPIRRRTEGGTFLEEGTDDLRTSKGKSIIDLHTEFAARKAAKENAIRAGQAGHAHVFHQDEELAAMIAQCEHRKSDSLHYGPPVDADSAWLRNMPMEEAGDVTNVIDEADAAASSWKTIMADARSAPPLGATLYTITNPGGRPTNLGWTAPNRFEAIADSHTEATPSKVADNA